MESIERVSLSMERLSIECIPEDVLFREILTKLEVKDVVRFKCVSKGWLARFSGDSFIADHLRHHSDAGKPSDITRAAHKHGKGLSVSRMFLIGQGDETSHVEIDMSYLRKGFEEARFFYIIGSSNGLVFIKFYKPSCRSQLVLWNPATRESRNLPEPIVPVGMIPKSDYDSRFYCHGIGFGNDCNDFKIVSIKEFETINQGRILDVQLFTKSSGCWRPVRVLSDLMLLRGGCRGVVIDGTMHCAVLHGDHRWRAKGSLFSVLTFDLHSEELKEIDHPASESDDLYDELRLVKWKSSLGAILTSEARIECHVLSKSNGLCWTKMFTLAEPKLYSCLGVFRDEFLLESSYSSWPLILFDPITERMRDFVEAYGQEISYFFDFQCHYVPSLISPN